MSGSTSYINSLASLSWVDVGGDNHITYYLANDFGNGAWADWEGSAYGNAMNSWANVANITTERVYSSSLADIQVHKVTLDQMVSMYGDWGGYAYFPLGSTPTDSYFNINRSYWDYDSLSVGGRGYELMTHEIGHALGIAHPHDQYLDTNLFPGVSQSGDLGDNHQNEDRYTVMSYNDITGATDHDGNVVGPMAYDIAAIQALYGADTNHNNGDTVYDLANLAGAWTSLWDTGGKDKIVYNGSLNATIDLRAATLDGNAETGGGGFSFIENTYGGFSIAGDYLDVLQNQGGETGVVIEQAQGGSGNDHITGNDADNVLIGGAGLDSLYGRGGNDTLIGGDGQDILDGGAGQDTVSYADSSDSWDLNLQTGYAVNLSRDGLDTLYNIENVDLGSGNDSVHLLSGSDNNRIDGGAGYNTVYVNYNYNSGYAVSGNADSFAFEGNFGSDRFVNIDQIHFADFSDNQFVLASDMLNGGSHALIANDDSGWTSESEAVLINWQNNDSTPEYGALSVTQINGQTISAGQSLVIASGAWVSVNADGTFTYAPNGQFDSLNAGEHGYDSFVYTMADNSGNTDMATVNLTIDGIGEVTGGTEQIVSVSLAGELGGSVDDASTAPHYEVWADGQMIGEGNVDWIAAGADWQQSHNWQLRSFAFDNGGLAVSEVEVRFTNDAGGSLGDRNLFVDYIKANGERFDAEGPGTSYDRPWGEPVSGQEDMLWNGALHFNTANNGGPVDPSGPVDHTVSLRMAGQQGGYAFADAANPHYQVYADDALIGEGDIDWAVAATEWPDDDNWQTVDFNFSNDKQIVGEVRVTFTNDASGSSGDRNMYVDHISIDNVQMEAEGPDASYDRNFDVIDGQEAMLWNGSLLFDNPAEAIA